MENIRVGKKDATDEEVLKGQDLPTVMSLCVNFLRDMIP